VTDIRVGRLRGIGAVLVVMVLWFWLMPLASASSVSIPTPTVQTMPIPAAPVLSAPAYLLIDYNSGQVLVEKNADEPMEPASITKLVSTYVIFNALKNGDIRLDDQVLISERAWRKGGSKMFIEVGDRVSVDNLLRGLIVQSGNDATIALAEHVSGSVEAFVAEMNATAQRLGMHQSQFMNATGWPAEGHVMSARDIAIIMAALIRDFPEYYVRYSEKEFTWNNIRQFNRNRLLWRDSSVDGGKTGHTSSAGYCLVASAVRDGTRLIAVVLGADSDAARTEQVQTLLNYGFRFFESVTVRRAGEVLAQPRVWKGEQREVAVGLREDLIVTIPRNQRDQLAINLQLEPQLVAPIQPGQVVGQVEVRLGDRVLLQREAIALQAVNEAGLIGRLIDSAWLWLQ